MSDHEDGAEPDEDNPRRAAAAEDRPEDGGRRVAPPPPAQMPVSDEGAPSGKDLPGVSVLVRNLSYDAREEDVREKFAEFGEVLDVYIPKERGSMRPRGMAFVKYPTQDEANAAVEKSANMEICGREIRCEIANQQRKSADEMRANDRGRGGYDDRRGSYGRRDDRPYARDGGFDRPRGVCYDWKNGKCDRGDSCRFAHSEDADRGGRGGYDDRRGGYDRGGRGGYDDRRGGYDDRRGGYDDRRGGDRPRGVCFDWQAGRCDRGASCRFAHEGEQRA